MYGYRTFNNSRYRFGSREGYFRRKPLGWAFLHMIRYLLLKRNKQKGPRRLLPLRPFRKMDTRVFRYRNDSGIVLE